MFWMMETGNRMMDEATERMMDAAINGDLHRVRKEMPYALAALADIQVSPDREEIKRLAIADMRAQMEALDAQIALQKMDGEI